MKIDVRFSPDFPPELRSGTKRLLRKWGPLFCRTADRLFVDMEDIEEGGATINVMMKYRQATITLSAHWVTLSAEEREEYVLHELAHIIVDPCMQALDKLFRELPEEAKTSALAAFCSEACEAVVEDVSRAVSEAAASREPRRGREETRAAVEEARRRRG